MTTLKDVWRRDLLDEHKNHFNRTGPITWTFLKSGRSVSVYAKGKGFMLKIHDNMTFKFRALHRTVQGTVKKDVLCLDAGPNRVVVGGFVSQKVWVFKVKEGPLKRKRNWEFLKSALKGEMSRTEPRLDVELYKFINAESGVRKVKLAEDEKLMAVLLPTNNTVEIWDIDQVTRLQTYTVSTDCFYMAWEDSTLVTAPTYSGIIQIFDTDTETKTGSIVGSLRRIDDLAINHKLIATAEGKYIKLWNLDREAQLKSWQATKGHLCSIFLNDVVVVSGSSAGVVKIWDLQAVFSPTVTHVVPIRRVTMKGLMHYPIKYIQQWSYTDLIIVAKYEAKKKKDKVKIVQVKTY